MSNEATSTTRKNSAGRIVLALIPFLIFAALAALFFKQLSSGGNPSIVPSALLGKPAPEFSMPVLAGLKRDGVQLPGLKTADFEDKVSIVNVWASWCVPCRAEHPALMEIAKDERISLVGINYKDKPENALRFLGQLGNPFAAVGTDIKGRAAIDWGVYGIPETFIVGPRGVIRYKHVGEITEKVVKKMNAVIKVALPKQGN